MATETSLAERPGARRATAGCLAVCVAWALATPEASATPLSLERRPAAALDRRTDPVGPGPTSPKLARRRARTRKPSARGQISYLAGQVVYLDRGAEHGLVPGMPVHLQRRGRQLATCYVDSVASSAASCALEEPARAPLRPGDAIQFVGQAPTPRGVEVPSRARPSPADAERALRELNALPVARHSYRGLRQRDRIRLQPRADAALRLQGWAVLEESERAFVRPSLDAGMRGVVPGMPGVFVTSALRVQGDVLAPANERFRPGTAAEVYVWDAALRYADPRSHWQAALGRLRPTDLPGMTVLDGVQLACRLAPAGWELGAYGGIVPDLVTLAPDPGRIAVGAYALGTWNPGMGVQVLPRLRVGLQSRVAEARSRVEAEGQLLVMASRTLSLGASARVGMPDESWSPVLDAVRLDAAFSPSETWRMRGAWRMWGDSPGELDALRNTAGMVVPPIRGSQRGEIAVYWGSALGPQLGLVGGAQESGHGSDVRGHAGPELLWPALFGAFGGLAAGHQEEFGFLPGRTSYVQAQLRPLGDEIRLWWNTRASLLDLQSVSLAGAPHLGRAREVWVTTSVDAPLTQHFFVRGTLQGMVDLLEADSFGPARQGTVFDVAIGGSL